MTQTKERSGFVVRFRTFFRWNSAAIARIVSISSATIQSGADG
jgi:hypothetical protein